jgi:hypothetical protein
MAQEAIMPRTCSICSHPARTEIDQALVNGEAFRQISARFGMSTSAVFRHKNDHIPIVMAKAQEVNEVRHGEDLLEQVRDLNQRTLRILREAEITGDNKTALAAIREARGNSELLCRMIVALEAAKREEDSQIISSDTIDQINLLVFGQRGKPSEQSNNLNPQSAESKEEWVERMVNDSIQRAIAE